MRILTGSAETSTAKACSTLNRPFTPAGTCPITGPLSPFFILHVCTTFCCHDQYVGNSIILHTSINGGPCFDIRLLLFSHGCGTLAAIFLIIVLAFMLWSSPFIATTFCPALGLSMALFMAVFTLDIAFFAFFLLLGISSKGFVLSLSAL